MRDDGVRERIGELGRRSASGKDQSEVCSDLSSVFAEHHRGEIGKTDTAPTLVVILALLLARVDACRERRRRGARCRPGRRQFPPDETSSLRNARCARPRDGPCRKSANTTKARAATGRSKTRRATFSPSANCTVRTPSETAESPVVSMSRARKRSLGKAASSWSSVAGERPLRAGRPKQLFPNRSLVRKFSSSLF